MGVSFPVLVLTLELNMIFRSYNQSIQWMMIFLTTMLIVEAYDRKFEILGKFENSSPTSTVNCSSSVGNELECSLQCSAITACGAFYTKTGVCYLVDTDPD